MNAADQLLIVAVTPVIALLIIAIWALRDKS